MFKKIKILEIFKNLNLRFFKVSVFQKQIAKTTQYHSGGDDYCPLIDFEGLGGGIGDNPSNSFVFAWRDDILKKSEPGEKRIYAVSKNSSGEINVKCEIYLKNDGKIEITGENIVVNSSGNTTINASSVNLGGDGGSFVLTESSTITDGEGRVCTISSNTTKTKAL